VTSPGIVGLATALASVQTAETLYPIAAQTRALADTEAKTGALCAAHFLLLAPACAAEAALDPDDWRRIQPLPARLGDFVSAGGQSGDPAYSG